MDKETIINEYKLIMLDALYKNNIISEEIYIKCSGMNRSTSINNGKSPKQNLNYNQTTFNYLTAHQGKLTERLNNLRKEKEELDENYLNEITPLSEKFEKDSKSTIQDFKKRLDSFIKEYENEYEDTVNQIKEVNNRTDWDNMLEYDETGRCVGLNDDEYFDNLVDGTDGLGGLLWKLENNIWDDEVSTGSDESRSRAVSKLNTEIKQYYDWRYGSKDMISLNNQYFEDTAKIDSKIDDCFNELSEANSKISVVEDNIRTLERELS